MELNNRYDLQTIIMNKKPQEKPKYDKRKKQDLFNQLCNAQFTPEYKRILADLKKTNERS